MGSGEIAWYLSTEYFREIMQARLLTLLFVAPEWVRNLTKERQPDVYWAEYVVFPLIQILVVLIVVFTVIAWMVYLERKVSVFLQTRLATLRVTPWALLQPASAGLKLLFNDAHTPEGADKAVFRLAPLIPFVSSLV